MSKIRRPSKLIISLLVAWPLCTTGLANANSNDDLFISNGLTKIRIDTEYQQRNPLSVVTSISIPEHITTVGQAFNYSLQRTGYQTQKKETLPLNVRHILMLELPAMHRHFKQATVTNNLDTLVGPAFHVDINHQLRTVNIREVL